ncbi:RDD family protein [Labilibaculum filiforme]|nr:RDD family protein [Labilibaculum filiforme]
MSFVFCVLWILIFSAILQKIKPQVAYVNADAQIEATKFHRLINVLVDTSLLLTLVLVFSDSGEYISVLILIAIYVIYYSFFEYQFGYTLGKLVTGTRVVQANGEKLRLKQALLRTLIRYIPVESFTYLINTSGWHDKWVGTKVLKVEKTLNKWYHYVLSIVVGIALFILFLALPQFLDEPYITAQYQRIDNEALEAELTKISTCFSQLDTTMTMTFDLSIDDNNVHASFSIDSITSNSVRLCAGLVKFKPKHIDYNSLNESFNDDDYNDIEDIKASYNVSIEVFKVDFEDCTRLEKKLLKIFKVNDEGIDCLKIKRMRVESYNTSLF